MARDEGHVSLPFHARVDPLSGSEQRLCESVRKKDCPDFASLSGLVDPLVVECSWEVEWGRRRLLWWKGVFERFKCSQT